MVNPKVTLQARPVVAASSPDLDWLPSISSASVMPSMQLVVRSSDANQPEAISDVPIMPGAASSPLESGGEFSVVNGPISVAAGGTVCNPLVARPYMEPFDSTGPPANGLEGSYPVEFGLYLTDYTTELLVSNLTGSQRLLLKLHSLFDFTRIYGYTNNLSIGGLTGDARPNSECRWRRWGRVGTDLSASAWVGNTPPNVSQGSEVVSAAGGIFWSRLTLSFTLARYL